MCEDSINLFVGGRYVRVNDISVKVTMLTSKSVTEIRSRFMTKQIPKFSFRFLFHTVTIASCAHPLGTVCERMTNENENKNKMERNESSNEHENENIDSDE